MITVTVSWPARPLWQNARVHWTNRSAATKLARSEARILTIAAKPGKLTAPVRIIVRVYPPSRRRMDMANVIGALKASIDGIADALGIDDSQFLIRWPEAFEAPVKGGKVTFEIETGETNEQRTTPERSANT
jgi:crossover junction endodeoxyribonuclease RusA